MSFHRHSFDLRIKIYYHLLNNPDTRTTYYAREVGVSDQVIVNTRQDIKSGKYNLKRILETSPGTSYYDEFQRRRGQRVKVLFSILAEYNNLLSQGLDLDEVVKLINEKFSQSFTPVQLKKLIKE